MIKVEGLSKTFDGLPALDGLDMNIPTGSIYGLVGSNGAGKTTIIKHLAGVIKQNSGSISFDGHDVWENEGLKQKIGLIPDELYFPPSYSLKDMRKLYSGAYEDWNEERFHELTGLFKLEEKRRIKTFSKGMKKQAMFSLVLATMPDYLLLDEPIDGLDPIVKKLVWKYILEDVKARGTTVLVSSHNLKELQDICDHIGIISEGKMILERELGSLKTKIHKIQVSFGNISAIGASIKEAPTGRPFGSDTSVYDQKQEEAEAEFKEEQKEKEAEEEQDAPKEAVKTSEEAASDLGASKFDPYKGLNILHKESRGTVDLLIIDNDLEEARTVLAKNDPIIMDILPLSLEEIFIYELGGENDEIRELIF